MADDKPKQLSSTLVIETIASLMTAAFGLLAALAWNEAIKKLVTDALGQGNDTLGLFVYALIVTVIAIVATVYIGRVLARYKTMSTKK